jgi:hypothetical protein
MKRGAGLFFILAIQSKEEASRYGFGARFQPHSMTKRPDGNTPQKKIVEKSSMIV